MGSKRKKQEKKKDFLKPKLKVGKTAAKPSNYTDTSFTAKSISLPNQSLVKSTNGLTQVKEEVDLTHHLLLTKHHAATTRKEVLNYIENHLPSNPSLYKQILSLTVSLITDQSNNVRLAFVSLLAACAQKQPGLLELHMRSIILFVHSAMSHIQSDIRGTSTAVLNVLIDHASIPLVKGHFVKTLKSYFTLMSWNISNDKKAISYAVNTSATLGGASKKARVGHLNVLQKFLRAALFENSQEDVSSINWDACNTIHPHTARHMLPNNPQAFTAFKFFIDELPSRRNDDDEIAGEDGAYSLHEIDNISTEDQTTRRKILKDIFLGPLKKNLLNIVKEGGEAGKEANSCLAVLENFEKEIKKSEQT